jgi:nucleoside-diphosphate-sugar epimerase
MTPTIAVLGASGFVGSRLLEVFHLSGFATVRPIVRNYSSLARLARFNLDWRVADACDQDALQTAFKGCDAVVNLVVADADIIVKNAILSYEAAQAAGVKRLVFMSSASVHGQAPSPGTDEASPLHTNHRFAYNNAKVRAELALAKSRRKGDVELVILRPAIVYGPRSRWIVDIADQLLCGNAYLVNGGLGVCNSIYVDNLIEAIQLALSVPSVDREIFLVGDNESVNWYQFYSLIGSSLGCDPARISRVATPCFGSSLLDTFETVRTSKPVQALLPSVPPVLKQAAKGAIKAVSAKPKPSPWQLPKSISPIITEEMTQLQSCVFKLPCSKAQLSLGYSANISFLEGMKRSIGWLEFAGYPVISCQ